jgi:oligopeptide/dipeptide ABC transporter ATP-binding protein
MQLSEAQMREIRGSAIPMIFQEPVRSLNPSFTIGDQINAVLRQHQGLRSREAIQMLDLVGIPESVHRLREYPHQLSGGMCQRVMIAMALSCRPQLLIADEPTTALDVTVQAQILDLMRTLKAETGTAILLITHGLGVVAEMAQRVAVMYAGRIVESAEVTEIFSHSHHPYTQALLACLPQIDRVTYSKQRLTRIVGPVSDCRPRSQGCRFAPRCSLAVKECHQEEPPLQESEPGHQVSCWLA